MRLTDISVNRQLYGAWGTDEQIIAVLACYVAYVGN